MPLFDQTDVDLLPLARDAVRAQALRKDEDVQAWAERLAADVCQAGD